MIPLKINFPCEQRFTTDLEKKIALEYYLAQIFNKAMSSAAVNLKKLPSYYKHAYKKTLCVQPPNQFAEETKRLANFIFAGFIDTKSFVDGMYNKKIATKICIAIAFTAAAEMVNHRNYYIVGYNNYPFALACENILADAKKRTDKKTLEELQYDNFPQIGDIIRTFCNNESIEIEFV